ncbi:WD40-repeat-containing domain protein [Melampsora americana]|nr:WD40-repeat-containing domain protein [Melampsora americana]
MTTQHRTGPAPKSMPLVCSGHTRPIPAISISGLQPDGQYMIISACKDGKPMLRDWMGDWIGTFLGHKGAVWSAKLNEDASLAVTGSADFSANVWDTFSGDVLHTFQHDHIVRAVDITPNGSHIFTGGMEKKLRRFDLNRPDVFPDLFYTPNATGTTSHDGMIKSVIWDDQRQLIISAGEDRRIRWWDPRLGGGPKTLVAEVEFEDGIASVERSFGGDWLSVASGKKAVFLDTDTRETIFEHTLNYPVSSCSLAPRTRDRFVTGSTSDGWVRVYDAMSGEMKEENKGHHGPVHSISFSPDGELYASGSEDGTIRLWQTTPKNYGLWRYDL